VKRLFDISLSIICLVCFFPLMCLLVILISLNTKVEVFYWSSRVGRDNIIFQMPKFRTMNPTAPSIATHLLKNPDFYMTPLGPFLRRTSLDELPQIWSILIGHMSFVGPRPALYNQDDLIKLRSINNIHTLLPGLTGFAQISGRDELSIIEKVKMDKFYLDNKSFYFDLKIIIITFFKVIAINGVHH
jgi:O-antigen biosynthesis protein WbqP